MSPEQPFVSTVTSHATLSSITEVEKVLRLAPESEDKTSIVGSIMEANQSGQDIKKEEEPMPETKDTRKLQSEGIQNKEKPTQQGDDFAKVFAEVANDDETIYKAVQAAFSSQTMGGATRLFNQEKEEEKLEIRQKQAVLHLTWTDKRIRELETEVKLLRRDVDGLPPGFEVKKISKQPVYDHVLKQSTLSEFKLNDESRLIPDNQRPALEVCFSTKPSKSATKTAEGQTGDFQTELLEDPDSENGLRVPEILRIRSRALLSLLGRISSEEILSVGYTRNIETPAPVVFLRPFKHFVTYAEEIRAQVPILERKIEKDAAAPPPPPGTKKTLPDFDNRDLLKDLKKLIQFLDEDLRPTFDLRKQIQDGTLTHIEFQDLWHLFSPGDYVVDALNDSQIFRVLSYTGGRDILIDKIVTSDTKPPSLDGFMVDCYNLNYNGSVFGPKLQTHSIRRFRGLQPINSLPIYPIQFDAAHATLRQDRIAQGLRYLELTSTPYVHKMLIGQTLDEPVEEMDAQVIVDMTLAINKNPDWNADLKINESDLTQSDKRETIFPVFCRHPPRYNEGCCGSDVTYKDQEWDETRFNTYFKNNRHALGHRKAHEIEGDEVMLLPFWVHGFVLRSRRWITFRIDDLSHVKYTNTFQDLVLPDGHKDTVEALVHDHANPSTQDQGATSKVGAAMDLVRGKGKGLIILLHGEPGVGKTSTAECVADLTKRPLFPITCGDIGEKASEVQTNLDYNFQLAHKWGCVLLLDEADVFLAKRSKNEMQHNAVVSVFLRTLEYYSGILFLTTNRVGSIDPAFKSRIHMSLFYRHLELKATMKLYQVFIDRTVEEQKNSGLVEFKIKADQIRKFAEKHYNGLAKNGLATWNGRQIRNAFQTAIALAEYEARKPGAGLVTLGRKQFETIAKASKEFDRYLKETTGQTEAGQAKIDGLRRDDFGTRSVGRTSNNSRAVPRSGGRIGRDIESEVDNMSDESEEDDDSHDDSDDSDEDDEEDDVIPNNKEKKVPGAGSAKSVVAESAKDQEEDDMEAKFKRFMELEKKKAKKTKKQS